MKTQNPIKYVLSGSVAAILIMVFANLVINNYMKSNFWVLLIAVQGFGIMAIAVNMLINTRRLNPQFKWLPLPFRF